MRKIYPDLPGWTFDMEEVSAGVYEVIAQNSSGQYTSAKGIELDQLVEQCKNEARRLSEKTKA